MKKKIVSILVSTCAVLALVACSGTETTESSTETATEEGTESSTESSVMTGNLAIADMDLSLITMPEYKGVEVEDVELIEVTDEDVQLTIDSILTYYTESVEVERPVETGDTVNIDYVGTLDGVAFDGGTAEGYDLTIGSGQFIDGFEDGLIGTEVGDVVSLDLTFPEEYSSEDLAGQAVVFEVTINTITIENIPELTDELVPTISTTATTVEEYWDEIRAALEDENLATQATARETQVWAAIIDKAEISEYPEADLASLLALISASYEAQASMYGMTIDEFVEASGLTMEDYEAYLDELAMEIYKSNLAVVYIATQEDLIPTAEEFDAEIEAIATEYGYESVDALYEQAAREDLEIDVLSDIVVAWLIDNSVFVEATTTEEVITEEATEETAE
ncbi:MAG: trigger factor [Eubacteriales bacterium]